ncbi:MAG: peptidylprolyl isomerase [Anaerocolumna sp.]
MKKISGFIQKGFILMIAATVSLNAGCSSGNKPYSGSLVLTVDGTKIYMDEMMYHVMLAAMQGELYASFVGNGEGYWNMKTEDGSTMREAMKNMALENAVKYQLFYQLALKDGYTLTEGGKQQDKGKVDNILNNMGEEQLNTIGLTKEKLLSIQDKITIASKYYDNYVNNLGVDEEAIKTQYKATDYKQYDIQYIYAGKENKEALTIILEAAKTAEDITALAKDTVLNYGKLSFLEGDNTFGEESGLEETIKVMDVGEVSDIVETVKGFYIIKLVDNTSTRIYDTAVKKAVDHAVDTAFDSAYESLKKEHKIEIKENVWNKVEIDKTIINSIIKATGNIGE